MHRQSIMKKTRRPLVVIVNGKVKAIVPGHSEVAINLDAVASIHRGLAQARRGMGRPADDVFDELKTRS